MSPTRVKILDCLKERAGELVAPALIVDAIGREISSNQLRVQISELRREIHPSGFRIEAIFGRGYRLVGREEGDNDGERNPDDQGSSLRGANKRCQAP